MKRKVKWVPLFVILVLIGSVIALIFYFNSVPSVCEDGSLLISNISGAKATIQSNSKVCNWGDNILVSTKKGVVIVTVSDSKSEILPNTEQVKNISVIDNMMYYGKDGSILMMDLNTKEIIKILNNKKYKMNGLTIVGDKIYGVNGNYNNYLACYDINTNEIYKIDNCVFPMEGMGYYNDKYYYIGDGGLNAIYAYNFTKEKEEFIYNFERAVHGFCIDANMMYVCGIQSNEEENFEYVIVVINLDTAEEIIVLKSEERIYLRGFINDSIIFSKHNALYLYDLEKGTTASIKENYGGDGVYVANNVIVLNSFHTDNYTFLSEFGEELYSVK